MPRTRSTWISLGLALVILVGVDEALAADARAAAAAHDDHHGLVLVIIKLLGVRAVRVLIFGSFVGGLIKGDDESWAWLFVVFVAALLLTVRLFEQGHHLVDHPLTAHDAGVATAVIAPCSLLLFGLRRFRPGFFAATEIAFCLVGIYFSLRALDGGGGAWAALALSIYGLVDGIDRLTDALAVWAADDEHADLDAAATAVQPRAQARRRRRTDAGR